MPTSNLSAKRHRNAIAVLKEAARQARAAESLPSSAFLHPIGGEDFVAVGTEHGIHALTRPEDTEWITDRLPTKKEWEASDGCFYVWSQAMAGKVRVAFYDRERKVFVGIGGMVPATRWRAVVLPVGPGI